MSANRRSFSKQHFYAIWVNFLPGSATANRMLAYFEAWAKMDVEVTVVFFLPDRSFSKVPNRYHNIRFVYLWDRIPIRFRAAHYVLYDLYANLFIRHLKENDKVYIYGQANLLPKVLNKKGIFVFHETTEHPDVIILGVRFHEVTLANYLSCCRRLNGLFVISSQLKSYFTQNGVASNRIEIINMVVDPSRFDGLEKKKNGRRYIAYCGNASNTKDGVDQLIRAFALVCQKYEDLYLYIIGRMPDPKEENTNAFLTKELGISNRVIFTGIVDYNEMPLLLKNSIMLALDRPDNIQAKYGFPTKLGEYLLTGNPVVITDTGDIALFLKDKVSAMIAEPDNVDEFASKIEWLLEHPEESIRIGNNGRQVALDSFNAEIEAKKIIHYMFKTNE